MADVNLKISVVVVCFNTEETITECIESLLHQAYPKELYEIIFVDNDSSDQTRTIIKRYKKSNPNIRLILNPVRNIAASRNLGVQYAQYEYIAYIDADCVAPLDWLQKLAYGFTEKKKDNPNLAGVGGANFPPLTDHKFYNLLTVFLNTYWGSHGSVQGKRFTKDKKVPHLPTVNLLYKKNILLQIGGFDNTLGNIGEDQDLSFRLANSGFCLYYIADCGVIHKMRSNWHSWIKNMFTYGKGRTWIMIKHPQHIEPALFFPFLFALLPFYLIAGFYHCFFLLPFCYFPIFFVISLTECIKVKKLNFTLTLFALYFLTHYFYGIGQWYGLFKKPAKPDVPFNEYEILDDEL